MTDKDDFLKHIQFEVDAFAALANSEQMDTYCLEHQNYILETLENYQLTEEVLTGKDNRRPEDIIDDEFRRLIEGA